MRVQATIILKATFDEGANIEEVQEKLVALKKNLLAAMPKRISKSKVEYGVAVLDNMESAAVDEKPL
jgi:hypothetical protein